MKKKGNRRRKWEGKEESDIGETTVQHEVSEQRIVEMLR